MGGCAFAVGLGVDLVLLHGCKIKPEDAGGSSVCGWLIHHCRLSLPQIGTSDQHLCAGLQDSSRLSWALFLVGIFLMPPAAKPATKRVAGGFVNADADAGKGGKGGKGKGSGVQTSSSSKSGVQEVNVSVTREVDFSEEEAFQFDLKATEDEAAKGIQVRAPRRCPGCSGCCSKTLY